MSTDLRQGRSARDQRREELGRQLLGVVEDLLAGGGSFGELSIVQLIKHAGIGRSTFYLYFEDRSALLAGLGHAAFGELEQAGAAWARLGSAAGREDVRGVVEEVVAAYLEHGVVVVAVAEAAESDARAAEHVDALLGAQIAALTEGIAAGQASGAIRAELDGPRIAAWLVRMTDRGARRLAIPAGAAERTRLLEALVDIVDATLSAA